MNKKITDGWHTVGDYDIYVENGCVIRGTANDGISEKTVYPYKLNKSNSWDNASGVKYDTFIRGLKENRYILS